MTPNTITGKAESIRVQAQPLIAVRDVAASSRWYQALLGFAKAGTGARSTKMLVSGGELVLQLHAWDVDEHVNLTEPDAGVRRLTLVTARAEHRDRTRIPNRGASRSSSG